MIKKIISVILSIMLMASMFTGVVFAQETTVTVSSTNAVTVKDGSTYGGVSAQKWTRIAFALYDFSDYIPYLYGADSITFSGQSYSDKYIYGLVLDALDDSLEQYVNTDLTWANAYGEYAMASGGYRLAVKDSSTADRKVTLNIDKNALISALETGDNGVVAVRFDSDHGSNSEVPYHSFTINYDDETYMQTIADGLEWSDVSDVASDGIAGTISLPSKLHGCDVTWQSNSSAIDVATGNVTAGANDQIVTLTATLLHNGNTATKAFDVTVASKPVTKKTVDKSVSVYVRGGSDVSADIAASPQDSSSYLISTAGSQYRAYVKFNFDGNEAFIENLAHAKFSMKVGGPFGSTIASPFNLVVLPDSAESYVKDGMVYNDASAAGIVDAAVGTVVASQDTILANGTVYESGDIATAIKNAIDANPANSSVLFGIYSTSGQGYFHSQSPVITLEYYEDEVDMDAFFNAKKDALEWSHISSQPINEVKENLSLTSKFYGFDVIWTSDNEVAVSSDGTVTRTDKNQKATLTATISYNGDSATKDFEVTVPKIAYAYGDELYDGTKSISKGATDANFTITSADGVFGKVAEDKVYKISAQSSSTFAIIDTATADGANDVFEFSAFVPQGAGNLSLNIGIVDGSEYGAQSLFTIKNDGIYNNYSNNKKIISGIDPNSWHTYAFVAPQGDGVDNKFELYIDGIKVSENPVATTTSGFRHIRVSSGGTDINVASGYMDNIRTYSGEYVPKYDVLDSISYVDGIGNTKNIIVKHDITVAQLKAGITAQDDTTIRVYESLSSTQALADSEYVKDGYVVIAASKNGTEIEKGFNCYTIDRIPYEAIAKTYVNGSEAKIYSAEDTLRAEVEFINYTPGQTFDATMYVAQYKYGELVDLWTETKTGIADSYTFTCDFEGMEDIENSNIKIMLVDNNFNPYGKSASMRFNSAQTEATLYLLGDSIVQTYVDATYPIQGWGAYIGDYLNDSITVDNRATSGWSTDHYLYPDEKGVTGTANEYKTWENIKAELKSGDYVMIALGINDAGSANISEEKYRENIETIYSEATAKGATVILLTPTIQGKDWGFVGVGFGMGGYEGRGAICQSIADSHNSVCLPLGAELLKTYNAMAADYLAKNPDKTQADANNYVGNYFHIYAASSTNPPAGWTDFGTATEDDTMHYNPTGANDVASVIAKLLLESESSLADYVVIPNN